MFQFEKVVCLSLARRSDRWRRFCRELRTVDWPFGFVEKYLAIDGDLCPSPIWWQAGPGAWGVYRSHLNILEKCLNDEVESCLFLEDDALCCENFAVKARLFFEELPVDWGMVYLGGQHLFADCHPPYCISSHVNIPFNVNRTHAFGLRGKAAMSTVYRHLQDATNWHPGHHVDHHLGRLHMKKQIRVYCPNEWLIGQAEGESDVCEQELSERFFS